MENALKHRHEKEIKEMEIKLQNLHKENVEEIREIKLEANNVVEKAIIDTEKHIQEVRTSSCISVYPNYQSSFRIFLSYFIFYLSVLFFCSYSIFSFCTLYYIYCNSIKFIFL